MKMPREFEEVQKQDLLKRIKEINSRPSRLVMITGVETPEGFEVLYHFDVKDALLTLRVKLARESPSVPTVTGELPGSILYEREIMEMFGINVEGIPDARKLFLPEDYSGKPPMLHEEYEKK